MIHEVLAVGALQCNCQILGDEASGRAFVVDPGDDIGEIQKLLDSKRLTLQAILFTHAHIDHIGRAGKLQRAAGVPAWLHPAEVPVLESLSQQAEMLGVALPAPVEITDFFREGDSLDLNGIRMEVLETPGHSPGGVSLHLPAEQKLLSGDALFHDSIGRTDLPGGDLQRLLESIRTRILTLDDGTAVFPGHGPGTTVGRERRSNPFLRGLA